jgi:hypothetical protein
MKLTDAHVSDKWINKSIETFERHGNKNMTKALLELKQRRAEDRAKGAGDGE